MKLGLFFRNPFFLFLLGILLAVPCPTVLARFHPDYRWHTVRNEHFILYYPQGHEATAERLLRLSEKVYEKVTGHLRVTPPPCPIVLDPGTDLFNGYTAFFPSRIALFETPRYPPHGLGPVSDLMELVFIHEYTHFVHITTRGGWYGKLIPFLGPGLAVSNILSPGWIIEGAAVQAETLLTDGGRGRSPLFLGEMRSFTEGPGLWGLNAASVNPPYAPPRSRIYLAGYHMVEYLNRTYGPDAFARLSRYQAEHPQKGTSGALKAVTGKSPEEFYRDFLADYLERAERTNREALLPGIPAGQVLLTDERRLNSYDAHFWTEKGTLSAFRRGYDRKNALVEMDPASGKILKEVPTGRLQPFSARRLPDGRFLLAEVFYHPLGEKTMDTADLVLWDPRTMKRKRLTTSQHIYAADLSPDGRTIAAVRRQGMWMEVILLNPDGSPIRPLISKPGLLFASPRWTPDGSRLAAAVTLNGHTDIVLIDPQTGAMETLFLSDAAEDGEPDFSPDGRWLVFTSDRGGIPNIFAWDLKERRLRQLTAVPYAAGDPHISPDGRYLSFTNLVRGVREIRLMPFEPSSGKVIPVNDPSPLPEPDLKRLQPEVTFTGKPGIPLKDYRPFAHFPYVYQDARGGRSGFFIIGADPVGLNEYTLDLFYGFDAGRTGFDFSLIHRSFWPTWSLRAYDSPLKGNSIDEGRKFLYREKGAELAAGLSIIHRSVPDFIASTLRLGTRLRRFTSLDDRLRLAEDADQSLSFFGSFQLSRRPDAALRDLVPPWGQDMYVFYEKGLSHGWGELPGYNTVLSLTQYFPSPFKHHGLAFTSVHQVQEGRLRYTKDLSLPRGYDDEAAGGLNRRKNLLFSLEYHFPIRYTDGGLGHYFYHSDLFKGSFFLDHGAGWDGGLDWATWKDRAVTSIGVTLSNRGVLGAVLPLEIGLRTGLKVREGGGFFQLFFALNL